MSKAIEREVVEFALDPREFKKGVEESLKQIELMKAELDFRKTEQGFRRLEQASNDVKFGRMADSIDRINNKMSVMGVVAATVIANITNSVINATKQLFTKTIVEPMRKGLAEYETQMNSIQTILANTSAKGTTLSDVQLALDELNRYADLTIYNFTNMTDAIGKFTAAGVDLDTSVAAIKGISNLAAVSGSNAHQAATAQYQLSQAIASGTVKLQDWNSVVNAGMGGEVFKNSLLETARVHGVAVDNMIAQDGSFRETLQRGWLTTDILLETLSKFTGDLGEEQLRQLGYNDEQIAGIMELGQVANDAATKIKTLSQLGDTIGEAVESGWAETWRIIFGDFDEAKELFGQLGDTFGGIVGASSDARNGLLYIWKDLGGRTILIDGLMMALQNIIDIFGNLGKGFRDIFPPTTGEQLLRITAGFWRLVEVFRLSDEQLRKIRWVGRGLASVLDIIKMAVLAVLSPFQELIPGLKEAGGSVGDFIVNLSKSIYTFRNFAKRTDFFGQKVSEIREYITTAVGAIALFVQKLGTLEIVQDITNWLSSLTREDVSAFFMTIYDFLLRVGDQLGIFGGQIGELIEDFLALKVVQDIGKVLQQFTWSNFKLFIEDMRAKLPLLTQPIEQFRTMLGNLGTSIMEFVNAFTGSEGIQNLVESVQNFSLFPEKEIENIENASSALGDAGSALETVNGYLQQAKDLFAEYEPQITAVMDWIKNALSSLGDFIGNGLANMDWGAVMGAMAVAMGAAVVAAVRNLMSGGWLRDIIDGLIGEAIGSKGAIVSAITDTMGAVQDTFVAIQNSLKAEVLQKIAIAIGLITLSIIALSFIDSAKLAKSLAVVGASLAGLFGASGVLSKLDMGGSIRNSLFIMGIAVGLLILAKALSELGNMNVEQLKIGLSALAIGLTELMLALKLMSSGGEAEMIKQAVLIQGISTSLVLLSEAVRRFGDIPYNTLKQGLIAVGVALAQLTVAMQILSRSGDKGLLSTAAGMVAISVAMYALTFAVEKFGSMDPDILTNGLLGMGIALAQFAIFAKLVDGKTMLAASVGLVVMAGAVYLLAGSIEQMGSMSWDNLVRGLVGLGGALLILAIAANLMNGALVGAAAMLIVSAAVFVLAKSLEAIGNLGWGGLLVALAGLAGFFIVLGLAAVILAPLIPGLMAIALVITLIGIGALAMGAGLFLAATGLVALAASATIVAAAIGIIGAAVIEILPKLAIAIGEAIVGFVTAIADSATDIFEAGVTLILTLIEAFTESIPAIIEAVFTLITEILDTFAENLPTFLQTGFDVLLAFLQGIEDNIQEVVDTALGIVEEFIRGITEGIPGLIDAAFEFILAFITAMTEAVDEYMPEIIQKFYELGEALVGGLVEALYDGFGKIATAAADMAGAAWEAFKEAAGIASPSKVFYALSQWIPRAIVKALDDGGAAIYSASRGMAAKAQNGMNSLYDAIEEGLKMDEFNPTVTPVLDMSQVQAGLKDSNGLFGGTVRVSAVGSRLDKSDSSVTGVATDSGDTYHFEQNIHAPKELNTLEIYRKTKSVVAKAAQPKEFKDK